MRADDLFLGRGESHEGGVEPALGVVDLLLQLDHALPRRGGARRRGARRRRPCRRRDSTLTRAPRAEANGCICVGDLTDRGVPYDVIHGIVKAQAWEVEDIFYGNPPYEDDHDQG